MYENASSRALPPIIQLFNELLVSQVLHVLLPPLNSCGRDLQKGDGMANGGAFQPIWICTRCNEKEHSPTSFSLPFLPASIASSSKAFHTTLYSNVPFRRPVSQSLWESTLMKLAVHRIPGRTSKFKWAKSWNSLAKFFTSQDTFGILEPQPESVFYAH